VEIRAVLKTARQATGGRVVAVVQPHRYSRLRDLFEDFCTCFADADVVLVAPVYAAGEAPVEGIDRDALVEGLIRHGQRNAQAIDGPEDLPARVRELARPGDLVVCLGAGTISQWANALPEQLRRVPTEAAAP
jgi:UDP-N-acetylmuramate--alanine ligase